MTPEPPTFRPRLPWVTGDLQTLRNTFRPPRINFGSFATESLSFPMDDGTEDVLTGELHRPATGTGGETPRSLVVLIHGLTGCFDSDYVRASALAMLQAGFPVLRLNLRAAGPINSLCREQYFAGRTRDLKKVFEPLRAAAPDRALLAVGYSLGGNMLLKYMGEEGAAALVDRAASVSAPIDLAATARRILERRNFVYHRYLLKRMKAMSRVLRGGLTPSWEAAVNRSRDVYEYDDIYIAPRYGFEDAEDYYRKCSAGSFLPAVRKPTLVVHAADDPWIPIDAYRAVDWSANPALTPLLPDGGGHVGFHSKGSRTTWHDARIVEYFRAA